MTYPVTFANLAGGNQPASDFDSMFAIVGQMGDIPCTASGTNAITLTPNTNYFNPASYNNGQLASFKAVNSSTGSVTAQIAALGFLNLYLPTGSQAGNGDIVSGNHYLVQYWSDLNSNAGGFLIINANTVFASLNIADQVLSGGVNITALNLGTATSGTITPDCGKCPLQYITNNGSFTLAPPTKDGAMMLMVTLGSSAGATVVNEGGSAWNYTFLGDAYVTATGNRYVYSIWRINGIPSIFQKALQ